MEQRPLPVLEFRTGEGASGADAGIITGLLLARSANQPVAVLSEAERTDPGRAPNGEGGAAEDLLRTEADVRGLVEEFTKRRTEVADPDWRSPDPLEFPRTESLLALFQVFGKQAESSGRPSGGWLEPRDADSGARSSPEIAEALRSRAAEDRSAARRGAGTDGRRRTAWAKAYQLRLLLVNAVLADLEEASPKRRYRTAFDRPVLIADRTATRWDGVSDSPARHVDLVEAVEEVRTTEYAPDPLVVVTVVPGAAEADRPSDAAEDDRGGGRTPVQDITDWALRRHRSAHLGPSRVLCWDLGATAGAGAALGGKVPDGLKGHEARVPSRRKRRQDALRRSVVSLVVLLPLIGIVWAVDQFNGECWRPMVRHPGVWRATSESGARDCAGFTGGSFPFDPRLTSVQDRIREQNDAVVAGKKPYVTVVYFGQSLTTTTAAIGVLSRFGLPMVSSTATYDDIARIGEEHTDFLFPVAPSSTRLARQAAQWGWSGAESTDGDGNRWVLEPSGSAVAIADGSSTENYGVDLAGDFMARFTALGGEAGAEAAAAEGFPPGASPTAERGSRACRTLSGRSARTRPNWSTTRAGRPTSAASSTPSSRRAGALTGCGPWARTTSPSTPPTT